MTPRRKVANISVFLAASLSAAGFVGRTTVRSIDGRYVHVEQYATDTLNAGYALRDLRRMVAGLDSSDRCNRGQTQFCR